MREIDKDELAKLRNIAEGKKETEENDLNAVKRRKQNESDLQDNLENIVDDKKIKKDKLKKEKKSKKKKKINDNNVEEKDVDVKKKNKKSKEKKTKKNIWLTLFVCIVIATFLCIVLFYFLDRFIYNLNHVNLLEENIEGMQNEDDINTGIVLEDGMTSVQYSYNNKYYTFLKDGKIYIREIATNAEVAVVESEYSICYYNLLYDKNRIFYITQNPATYSTYLQIWTYEISSGETSEYNEFSVSGFVKVKDLEFSPIVNILYLNVERNINGKTDNIVYRIDLFNNMTRYASNMIINEMVMLKLKEGLYFEDGSGLNYYAGYVLRIFNENVDLIGVDLNDKVYFISSDRTKIYVTQNRKILNTITLENTNMINWYSDNTNVYLIYPEYVICISADEPLNKVAKMSKYMTFQTIKGNTMYLLTNDNRIITTKIDV